MKVELLALPIIIPLIASGLIFLAGKKLRWLVEAIAVIATAINLILSVVLFKSNAVLSLSWLGPGMDFSFRMNHFSAFILAASAVFGLLIAVYSVPFMRSKPYSRQFYAYLLISLAFTSGSCLSDNLLLMFFFWEGLLITLFGMIAIGGKNAFKTAAKAFIIVGISDLCLMFGIALVSNLAGTLSISRIALPLSGMGVVAFILLMIGAISKAGAMPFHSWIPDAANDAPLPFMALIPGSLEKLLGIYFLTRISLDMFRLSPGSWISTLLMAIGAITIILAVMMALIQKDYKRLLSYHAISQVGYMILGIGTALPIGIAGGIFHMINNALYKSGLFLTAGAVERQTGSTSLEKLGGIGRKMPVTFGCFIICALSISGVWPFNGFFSKELLYDAALERGLIFYLCAVVGSFFTAASFLKLGHSVFLGRLHQEHRETRESPVPMLAPMIFIAGACIVFGVFNSLPLGKLIEPVLGEKAFGNHGISGFPANKMLVIITAVVLLGAIINHVFGFRIKKSAVHCLDHIRYARGLSYIYDKAEKRFFDPYQFGMILAAIAAKTAWFADRAIDWLYDGIAGLVNLLSQMLARWQTRGYSASLGWALAGTVLIIIFLFKFA